MKIKYELRKNVTHAIFSFSLSIVLVYVSYRLVILNSGIKSLGLWSTLVAWMYLARLGDAGIAGSLTRHIATLDLNGNNNEIREYIDTSIIANTVILLVLSIFGFSMMINFILYIMPSDANSADVACAISILPSLFLGFFFLGLSGVINGALQGIHYGYLSSKLLIIGSLVQLIIVLYSVPKFGLIGLSWGIAIQYMVMTLIGWIYLVKKIGGGKSYPSYFSIKKTKFIINYGLQLQGVNVLNGFFEPLSKIIMNNYGGLAAQGLYEIAYKTVALPRNAIMSGVLATNPAMTKISIDNADYLKNFYLKNRNLVFKASFSLTLMISIFSPLISLIWIGEINIFLCIFLMLMSVGFFVNTYAAPAYNLGVVTKNIKNNFFTAIISIIILAVFGTILGYYFGGIGVAISSACSLVIGGLYIKIKNENALFGSIND